MDGLHSAHANWDQTKEVLSVSTGRSDEQSRRSGATEENMFCSMPISLGRSVLQVRVRRTSDYGPGIT